MARTQEERWTLITKVCVIVFLASMALASAPLLNCMSGGTELEEGASPTFEVCSAAHPISGQRLPVGLAVGSFLFGVFALFRRKAEASSEHYDDDLDQVLSQGSSRIEDDGQLTRDVRGIGRMDVEAIDVSYELDIRSTDEEARHEQEQQKRRGHKTLMDMVAIQVETIKEREEQSRVQRITVEGFYCPRPLAGKPIVYVDPSHESASDEQIGEEAGALERPFKTITAAIDHAQGIVKAEQIAVQVRVMPGVYQESLTIPSMVSVLNHRIPGDGGIREHLQWLRTLTDIDHPERVTILPPPHVPIGVLFERGEKQGLYGCHVVCRDGTQQVGLGNEHSTKLMVRTCWVEGFKMGGVQLNMAGGELPGSEVRLEGSVFTANESERGGAVALRNTMLSIHVCVFEDNLAQSGGAIYALQPKGTLNVTSSRFLKNRAKAKTLIKDHPEDIPLASWYDLTGLGGAVVVEDGYVKMALCQMAANGASTAGGAVALLSSRAILQGDDDQPMLIKKNRARTGGGVFAIGLSGERTTIKASNVHFEENLAEFVGGGFAMIASAIAQVQQSVFLSNESKGQKSLGGGVGCIYGSEFMAVNTTFRNNRTTVSGGAIGVRNASLSIKGNSLLQDNISLEGRCGGVYFESTSGQHLDDLLEHGEIQVPLVCRLLEAEMVGNRSAAQPSALFVGNLSKWGTLPIELHLGKDLEVRSNVVEQKDGGEMTAVFWCGEPKMTSKTMQPGKMMLS